MVSNQAQSKGKQSTRIPPLLNVQRMTSIECGVQDVGGVSTFAYGELDRIFFVGISTAMVSLVEFKGDMRLRRR